MSVPDFPYLPEIIPATEAGRPVYHFLTLWPADPTRDTLTVVGQLVSPHPHGSTPPGSPTRTAATPRPHPRSHAPKSNPRRAAQGQRAATQPSSRRPPPETVAVAADPDPLASSKLFSAGTRRQQLATPMPGDWCVTVWCGRAGSK
jgi:hypothetical protein